MKTFKLRYQQVFAGNVYVKAKDMKEARKKATRIVEVGDDTDILSSEVIILK
jgi:hypothetical protein